MTKIHVQIPNTAGKTFKELAEWLRRDLCERKAEKDAWDETVIYLLPESIGGKPAPNASVKASILSRSAISVMPDCGKNGVFFMKDELPDTYNTGTVTHRIRIAMMREHKQRHASHLRRTAVA